jgi:hypothetical protein
VIWRIVEILQNREANAASQMTSSLQRFARLPRDLPLAAEWTLPWILGQSCGAPNDHATHGDLRQAHIKERYKMRWGLTDLGIRLAREQQWFPCNGWLRQRTPDDGQ